MDIAALASELTTDPLGRGYSGMSDAAAAASLNDTIDRTLNKSSMTGDEVFAVTDSTEWAALTDLNKQLWMAFCGRSDIDPFQASNVALVQNLFGGGSTTQSSLATARVDSVSRGVELGLGTVREGHVQEARA